MHSDIDQILDILERALIRIQSLEAEANSLSRLTAGGLKCQRALGDEAERVARVRQQQKPKSKKGLSKQALKEMNDKLRLM